MEKLEVVVLDEEGLEVGRYSGVKSVAVQRDRPGQGHGMFVWAAGGPTVYENVRSAVLRLHALRDPKHPEKGCICIAVGPAE